MAEFTFIYIIKNCLNHYYIIISPLMSIIIHQNPLSHLSFLLIFYPSVTFPGLLWFPHLKLNFTCPFPNTHRHFACHPCLMSFHSTNTFNTPYISLINLMHCFSLSNTQDPPGQSFVCSISAMFPHLTTKSKYNKCRQYSSLKLIKKMTPKIMLSNRNPKHISFLIL